MYLKEAYRGKTDFWRYLILFMLVLVLNLIAGLPYMLTVMFKGMANGQALSELAGVTDPKIVGLSENLGLFLLIAPLILVFAGLVMGIRYMHETSWTSVFTSAPRFRWKHFLFAALFWLILLIGAEYINYVMHPESYIFQFRGRDFFVLLLISLLFFPFQTAWEELYFRGNLMQAFGVLSRTRYVPLIITSALFGLVHIFNPEVKEFGTGIALTQYMGFGLLLGITVIMDGGLEMAFGMHAINNIYAASLVSYKGSVLHTPALINSIDLNLTFMTMAFFVAAIVFLVAAKYLFKWKSFLWIFTPLRKEIQA